MVDKNDDLIIQVAADTAAMRRAWTKVESEVNGLSAKVNRQFGRMGQNIDRTFANVGQNMTRNLTGPLAGVSGVLATREVAQYADAWTTAGNKLAAASQVAGMQARGLSELNQIANETRSGITETADLYAKLLRSTKGVAQSELEVARATEIVNKAFKAGGAALSEQQAGILQLSQGLGSGMLQGDELRSVRENAPLLAQAIADYFKTTIGGLKKLGSEGELTSDKIFKAILSAQPGVEAAFGRTNATIEDGVTKVRNALTQYIGGADQSAGATAALNVGLNALADDFDTFADVALKLAAIIAGALVGRSILGMVGALGVAGKGVVGFVRLLTGAAAASGSTAAAFTALNAAAGPLALIIGGGVALAMQNMVAQNAAAESSIAATNARMEALGLSSKAAAGGIDQVATATDALTAAEKRRSVAQAQADVGVLKEGTLQANFMSQFAGNADLKSLFTISNRSFTSAANSAAGEADRAAYQIIQAYVDGIRKGQPIVAEALAEMVKIEENPEVTQDVVDLVASVRNVLASFENQETAIKLDVDATGIDYATAASRALRDELVQTLEWRKATEAQRWGAADKAWAADLGALIEKLEGSSISAEDAKTELDRLAGANPRFEAHMPAIAALINKLIELATAARAAKTDIEAAVNANSLNFGPRTDDAGLGSVQAGQKYLAELDRVNGLTRNQRDLEAEIARIRKDMPEGAFATPADIEARAKANLAWKEDNKKSGGGKSDAESFRERLINEQLSVDLLAKEATVMGTLNPLAKDYETTLEAWRMQQELLNDARKAGLADDPAVIAGIQQIVDAWKDGTEAIKAVQDAQDIARESMQEWFDLGRSSARGFIDDLIEGKTAAEALGNVFSQLGSKLIDLGLSGLFGKGGGDFGAIGKLFGFADGGIAANGRPQPLRKFAKGGVSKTAAIFGEAGAEAAVPLPDGRRIPVDLRMPPMPTAAARGGDTTNVPISIEIDATGADAAGLARVERKIDELKAVLPGAIRYEINGRGKRWIGR